jgi:two-component system response regulator AtoC
MEGMDRMEDLHLEALRIEQGECEGRFLAVSNMLEGDYSLVRMLADAGLSGEGCSSGDEALGMLKDCAFQGVLCDYTLADMGGMELLSEIRTKFPEVAFVMVADSGDVRHGVLAMIAGASDYLLKPLRTDAVVASLRRALKRKRIERSLAKYQEKQSAR